MKILSIETSCDETAISIIEIESLSTNRQKDFNNTKFKILANNLISQIDIHKEYGGVFPALAKREHSKNLIPILQKTLTNTNSSKNSSNPIATICNIDTDVSKILEREPELLKLFMEYIPSIEIPNIDAIAVTQGPGLEPALWVGINFAKALSLVWNKPLIPVNHMKGHLLSAFISRKKKFSTRLPTGRFSIRQLANQFSNNFQCSNFQINEIKFPAIGLLISGGHTELVLMNPPAGGWNSYEKIGQTRDDAVGEAFDKVARMMGLPYPGGPEISKLAQLQRNKISRNSTSRDVKVESLQIKLPRPMLNTDDFDFSFSGLKTSVLYLIKKLKKDNNWGKLPQEIKQQIALEFEEAVTEILLKKTEKAIEKYQVKTLILGGGVVANNYIRESFQSLGNRITKLEVLMPDKEFSTDNAVMIGIAGYFEYLTCPLIRREQKEKGQLQNVTDLKELKADGNLKLE